MNIALFASSFHPHIGGVEEVVRQICHANSQLGIQTIVLTNRWPRDLSEHETFEGIEVYRLPFRVPQGKLKARVNYLLTHGRIRRRMLEILREQHCDLAHVHCVSDNAWYARIASRDLKIPLVVTAHGELTMDAGKLYQWSEFARKNLRGVLTEARAVTGCSEKTLADVERFYGKSFGPRGHVIYNGTNPKDFAEASAYQHAKPYFAAMGRMVPQKGFDVLLRAWAKAGIGTHDLLMAGDGVERAGLEKLCADLKLNDRVKFRGRLDRAGANALLKGSDVFVLPSRADEGLPMVCLEAMTAAKPIIASGVGGVPEFVLDGQTGILVPPENVDALSEKIKHLAADEELRRNLGYAGRERVSRFTWIHIAQQYADLYQGVLPGGVLPGAAKTSVAVG